MRDIYQTITDAILASMQDAARWQKPWKASAGGAAISVTTGKAYRGINQFVLGLRGFTSPEWGTYKAWQAKGANVRKGEKGTAIVFWKQCEAKPGEGAAEGEARRRFLLAKGYYVFNADQVDGYERPATPAPVVAAAERDARAEAFILATGADIRYGGGRAFYAPSTDHIQCPKLDDFTGTDTSSAAESYYSTMLHELTHWSGAKARLDRDLSGRFGTASYAAEELVAELGAAFLCGALGITTEPRPDHAHYLASWITLLQDDNRAIVTAASKAQAAADFLLGLEGAEDAEPEALAA